MKPLHFAIASIADAHYGFGFNRDSGHINYAAAERRAREARSHSFARFLKGIGTAVSSRIDEYRRNREYRHGVNRLARLNDHLLEDIGVNRSDVIALQLDQIDVAELEARRTTKHGRVRVNPAANIARPQQLAGKAVNDTIFSTAKCA